MQESRTQIGSRSAGARTQIGSRVSKNRPSRCRAASDDDDVRRAPVYHAYMLMFMEMRCSLCSFWAMEDGLDAAFTLSFLPFPNGFLSSTTSSSIVSGLASAPLPRNRLIASGVSSLVSLCILCVIGTFLFVCLLLVTPFAAFLWPGRCQPAGGSAKCSLSYQVSPPSSESSSLSSESPPFTRLRVEELWSHPSNTLPFVSGPGSCKQNVSSERERGGNRAEIETSSNELKGKQHLDCWRVQLRLCGSVRCSVVYPD